MTKSEVAKLIYTVKAIYKRHYENYKTNDWEELIAAWTFALEDFTYEQCSAGLKVFITGDKKGFPPSPGQIIDCIQKVKPNVELEMTGLEAWSLVRKAITRGLYRAEEEYAKLPAVVQRAIGSADNIKEMAMMETQRVETVEQSHFIRAFESLIEVEKEKEKMPGYIREQLPNMNEEVTRLSKREQTQNAVNRLIEML